MNPKLKMILLGAFPSKNLFDDRTLTNVGSQTHVKNGVNDYTFTKTSLNGYSDVTYNVIPNTKYSLSALITQISGSTASYIIIGKTSGMTNIESNADGTIIIRFRASDASVAGSARFYNIQLEKGLPTAYEPFRK